MTNPLSSGGSFRNAPFADMTVGEERRLTYSTGETRVLRRTKRPFVYDFVDSSNDLLPAGSHFVWVVDSAGQAQLVNRRFAASIAS